MKTHTHPTHYRPAQKVLHWIVVLGIIIQIAIHEPIVRVMDAIDSGAVPDSGDSLFAWLHVGVGSTVLISVLARLYLRFRYGAPDHLPSTSPKQAKLADFMHWALYALLLGMVTTGMLTWNGIAPLGDVHFIINIVLFFMILGHAGAALYNQFVRKDGTMNRMLPLKK